MKDVKERFKEISIPEYDLLSTVIEQSEQGYDLVAFSFTGSFLVEPAGDFKEIIAIFMLNHYAALR